jgi:glycosyltransferase involved in cell wall biosynthesis
MKTMCLGAWAARRSVTGDGLISVIIPVFNGAALLPSCLAAVCASDYPAFEVIVVDDGSTDDSAIVARRYTDTVIELGHNAGPAAARNRGARLARGPILFFLDGDIVIERDTLRRIAGAFQDRPEISALFCSYQPDTIPTNFVSAYKNLLHHYTHQIAAAEAATFCGGFGAIRRDAFWAMGGFDERHRSLEDIELGYRLHQAGHRTLLAKTIQVTHGKRYSLTSLIRSDVRHRAMPWTRLMLDRRIFRNDLNTRLNNVLSVPVAFALVASPALWIAGQVGVAVSAGLALALVALNSRFLLFLLRRRGLAFALQAIPMIWFGYLYSGVGLIAGVGIFAAERSLTPTAGRKVVPPAD